MRGAIALQNRLLRVARRQQVGAAAQVEAARTATAIPSSPQTANVAQPPSWRLGIILNTPRPLHQSPPRCALEPAGFATQREEIFGPDV
jgi:hypothetical protein